MTITEKIVLDKIRPIDDPELGMSLVDMGLIYKVAVTPENAIKIDMTLSTPTCPIGPQIMAMVRSALLSIEGVTDVDVELVWDPPWNPATMATDAVKDALGIW